MRPMVKSRRSLSASSSDAVGGVGPRDRVATFSSAATLSPFNFSAALNTSSSETVSASPSKPRMRLMKSISLPSPADK
jgi:hypothetical protein